MTPGKNYKVCLLIQLSEDVYIYTLQTQTERVRDKVLIEMKSVIRYGDDIFFNESVMILHLCRFACDLSVVELTGLSGSSELVTDK